MALYHKWDVKLASPLPSNFYAYFWRSRWCDRGWLGKVLCPLEAKLLHDVSNLNKIRYIVANRNIIGVTQHKFWNRSWLKEKYKLYGFTFFWELLNHCLIIARWPYENCLKTVWQLLDDCLTTARLCLAPENPDDSLTTAWHVWQLLKKILRSLYATVRQQ